MDVGGLSDCLVGIYSNKADSSILDVYCDIRRKKYQEIVDPISSANFRRMFSDPDEASESDEFLQMCKRAESEPGLGDKMLQVGSVIP